MELKSLKQSIKDNSLKEKFFIFIYNKDTFLVEQYYKSIFKDISYVDDLNDMLYDNNIFEESSNYIYKCEELKELNSSLIFKNLIIITKKVSKEIKNNYFRYIVEFPDLEKWQIEDYAYTLGEGIDKELLKKFIINCNYNIYRIDNELQKLKGFNKDYLNNLFKKMEEEGAFEDISSYNIFDLTNALQSKDYGKLRDLFYKLPFLEIESPLLTITLYQGFKNIIKVWLDKYPTPESTGLKSNQIWAIKNIPHNYSKEQLVKIFKFLTSLDYELKAGNLPNPRDLVDYIILKVLLYGDS